MTASQVQGCGEEQYVRLRYNRPADVVELFIERCAWLKVCDWRKRREEVSDEGRKDGEKEEEEESW